MSYGNVYEHELLFNWVLNTKLNMALPELIYATIDGGTIHRYDRNSIFFDNYIIIATNNREFSFYKKLIIYLGYSSER